ncbi:hypothetical protein CEUSTIGMA_g6784.t1 [Chlamydomonas eustigma]|uniref:Protein kinase domain-containing protein n=1 Tax=Chlamydomonas eustigma TaxID=1157962 RepID=A0A250X8X2_9CHLO|nr:hypothetical protein CEUSTIGMA_g6784.t1 [Chlamydomonas eustigma]|eukprot:GAX79342.1 hypothetical protein CEUSTIGMA_g6784.t1 [Chlamydomonas eustigma]
MKFTGGKAGGQIAPTSIRLLSGTFALLGIHTAALFRMLATMVNRDPETMPLLGAESLAVLLTIAVEVVFLTVVVNLITCNSMKKITVAATADRTLLITGILIPLANTCWSFSVPTYDVSQRNFVFFSVYMMLIGLYTGAFTDLPVPYSVLQLLLSFPFYLYLDYRKVYILMHKAAVIATNTTVTDCLGQAMTGAGIPPQNDLLSSFGDLQGTHQALHQQCSTDMYSGTTASSLLPHDLTSWAAFLLQHCLSRGTVLFFVGLMTSMLVSLLIGQHGSPTQSQQDPDAAASVGSSRDELRAMDASTPGGGGTSSGTTAQQGPPYWPMETFGTSVLRHRILIQGCSKISSVLQGIDAWLSVVSGANRAWVVCLPFSVAYFIRVSLARMDPQTFSIKEVQCEEWLLVMVSFFLLGRESMNLDVEALVGSISALQESFQAVPIVTQRSVNDLIDNVRRAIRGDPDLTTGSAGLGSMSLQMTGMVPEEADKLKLLDLLGEGAFARVYRGLWDGIQVAVKIMILPGDLSRSEKRERMAIMEAAISTSLSHPNIVQTYTYSFAAIEKKIRATERDDNHRKSGQSVRRTGRGSSRKKDQAEDVAQNQDSTSSSIDGFKVQLVLEFCDCGSLRDALDKRIFFKDSLQVGPADVSAIPFSWANMNYEAILDTAIDIARGMAHLHQRNIVHSDLKPRNVLLMSSSKDSRGIVAKVSDFGLSFKMEGMKTHTSNFFQGTLTHMSPEVMEKGIMGKAADVYSFGITLWELLTGLEPFREVNPVYLAYEICKNGRRPEWPPGTPKDYQDLACHCWSETLQDRPTMSDALDKLVAMKVSLEERNARIQAWEAELLGDEGDEQAREIEGTSCSVAAAPAHELANGELVGFMYKDRSAVNAGVSRASSLPEDVALRTTEGDKDLPEILDFKNEDALYFPPYSVSRVGGTV